MDDKINHPAHYTFGKIEVLDAIEDWKLPYHLGNVIKYIARAPYKGDELDDLKKARFYLDRYIELLSNKLNYFRPAGPCRGEKLQGLEPHPYGLCGRCENPECRDYRDHSKPCIACRPDLK